MAAVNINGVTLHSWAGIGLGNGKLDDYVRSIKYGTRHWEKARERWKNVETLIIDESNVPFCDSGMRADNTVSIHDRRHFI